jgi:hypothetical protein
MKLARIMDELDYPGWILPVISNTGFSTFSSTLPTITIGMFTPVKL